MSNEKQNKFESLLELLINEENEKNGIYEFSQRTLRFEKHASGHFIF